LHGAFGCRLFGLRRRNRSGDSRNSIKWSEVDNKITADEVTAGASDSAAETHEATFTIEVVTAGEGKLVFAGGENKGPQIDNIVITRGS
jgi:hypothetical protein